MQVFSRSAGQPVLATIPVVARVRAFSILILKKVSKKRKIMDMEYRSSSVEETQSIAAKIAADLIKKGKGEPVVIALEGELGAGKTAFVQGFVQGLNIPDPVRSPTFILMKRYDIPDHLLYHSLYHLDCYRIKDEHDLEVLGVKELLDNEGTVHLIEWAERVRPVLPKRHITVHIDHVNENERRLTINEKE